MTAGRHDGDVTVIRSLVTSDSDEGGAAAVALAALPSEGHERIARMWLRRHRIGAAVAHALLRVTRSWRGDTTAPGGWRFGRSHGGQPLLAGGHEPSFSLTHADGVGLALGFARYGFKLGGRITLSNPRVNPAFWRLESVLQSGHRLAVAVETSTTDARHVVCWKQKTWRDLLTALSREARV